MVFHVVAVGRIRDAGIRASCDEYIRRAGRGLTIVEREIADAGRRGGTASEKRRRERDLLRKAIPSRAQTVALTRTGHAVTSRELADRVQRWRESARDVALLLGGAHGLDPELVAACDAQISLSPLTLPHDLARLMLLEQLYRASTLLDGHPYHKGG